MTEDKEDFFEKLIDNNKKAATKEFQDATPLLDKPKELHAQAEKDGYLFFRGVFPTETLLMLRRQILEVLQKWGLLDQSKQLIDGIADYEAVNKLTVDSVREYGFPVELYWEIYKLELFHKVAHEPALLNVFHRLFQTEPFPHPKTIARIVLPHRELGPTPSHQDFIHIQGTTQTWTAWFPLSDCPRELGGLTVLEGSHHCGVLGHSIHKGFGGSETILCGLDMDWVVGDYRLGDVLIFHSQTVHKALPNSLRNQIRLSCDFRYQPIKDPINDVIDQRSFLPHVYSFDWEKIYAGWTDDTLKYYWKNKGLTLTQRDNSLLSMNEKGC